MPKLTYGDFHRTGLQDCANAISLDEFEGDGTPAQIVDRVWRLWEDEDDIEARWIAQQDDFEGLDPHRAYERWRDGWKSCAVEILDRHQRRERDNPARKPGTTFPLEVKKLFALGPKVDATITDVDEGRLSYSSSMPLVVSRLDHPRGAYYIIDGHHRAVEAVIAGRPTVQATLDENVPRIERMGGAYHSFVSAKVNVYDRVTKGPRDNPARSAKTELAAIEKMLTRSSALPANIGSLEHYKHLANLAQRWSRGPFHAPPELRKYTARVPKETPIGAEHFGLVDREFWLGEILGDIRRDAERDLSREELANLDRFFDLMTERPPYKANPGCPVENPAWVTNILSKHLVELEESIPAKWLPKLTKTSASRGRISAALKEYGCGAYGCVLPTMDPKVVLKLTTDDTEAQFAHELADTLAAPVVVKYHLTLALPDEHKRRKSFLLWRDSADRVGELGEVVEERGGDGAKAEQAIDAQHAAARKAFEALDRGADATALLEKWERKAREMGEKVPELSELADGMITNLHEQGIFMGDVHGGNIGRVGNRWVVVDPGHIAVVER